MNETIYCNGIDLDTGTYAIPPMSVDELDALIRGEKPPENINELNARAQTPKGFVVKEGVDAKDLAQAGWGVIFADDADPQVEEALRPLLKLREGQAGKRFQRYAYQVGQDTKDRFLARFGAGPGPADPDKVPYYLLIVGGPEKIPYSFQSQLDVQYAVGRIQFNTLAEYGTYADSVVAAETGRVKLPRQASFFGVTHRESDVATDQSLEYLVKPLLQSLNKADEWSFDPVLSLDAKKEELVQRLGGARTPALLFTASHGLRIRPDSKSRLSAAEYQGALICADWPGPGNPFEQEEFFFAGKDLAEDANLQGLIALFFACFSGGTPKLDAYNRLLRLRLGQQPGPALELAPQPFIAALPRKMLAAPAGGALAVIGHVEQAWPSSYLWKAKEDGSLPPQITAFESTLRQLMNGYPVGAAVEFLNSKYAELTSMLQPYLEAIQFGDAYDRVEFVNVWMAATDAQWYTIIGDPAVRLPVVDIEQLQPRPVLFSTPAGLAPAATGDRPETGSQGAVAGSPGEISSAGPQPPVTVGKEETMKDSESSGAASTSMGGPAQPGVQSQATPDLFATPFSPPPAVPELGDLKKDHPELYTAYVDHLKEGYQNNSRIFGKVLNAFMASHYSTVIMYWILFAVGVGAVVAAIVLGLLQNSLAVGAAFIGVGAAAFVAYFIGRSTQSVEENLVYITWLGVIYNSYWTHLAWAMKADTAQAELDKATADALAELQKLLDRHAKSVKGRPGLGGTGAAPAPPAEGADAGTATAGG